MKPYTDSDFSKSRRKFLKYAGIAGLLSAAPAYAQNIFKILDPEGKHKDLQKAQKILEGAGNIISSTSDIDYEAEFAIGESLSLEGFKRYGLPAENKEVQKYVNLVGNAVARSGNRADIPYYFTIVQSSLYNAFACPGGIIFVTSTLVKSMDDESQLAGVLAHEIAHVNHKHALDAIQQAKFFEGLGKISAATLKGKDGQNFQKMIGGLQTVLFDKGLSQNMEYEADQTGMEVAYRTGYNPSGFIQVLEMLREKENTATKGGSWFSTHPPLSSRITKCTDSLSRYRDASGLAQVKSRFEKYRNML